MKKYYYLKQKVEIGDVINYNGLKIVLTEAIVNANPDLFVVEEEKEVLFTTEDGVDYYLNQDRKKYWLIDLNNKIIQGINEFLSTTQLNSRPTLRFSTEIAAEEYVKLQKEKKKREELLEEAKRRYPIGTKFIPAHTGKGLNEVLDNHCISDFKSEIIVDSKQLDESWNGCIYYHGKWAEIVKDKTLEDYENILSNKKEVFSRFASGCPYYYSEFYQNLKIAEPKLYYTKVLQLIADDLNGDWKLDWKDNCQNKHFIYYYREICFNDSQRFNRGIVYFKSEDMAQKAVKIMGDKLNLIFE